MKPDAVSTTYSYESCASFLVYSDGSLECFVSGTFEKETAPFIPTFSYNYQVGAYSCCIVYLFDVYAVTCYLLLQCTSLLQDVYVPTMIIGCGVQLLVCLAFLFVASRVAYPSIPTPIQTLFHGVFWPEYWYGMSRKELASAQSQQMFRAPGVICFDILHPVAMLLTFGLSSPVLGVMVTVVGVVKIRVWVEAISRFCSTGGATGSEDNDDVEATSEGMRDYVGNGSGEVTATVLSRTASVHECVLLLSDTCISMSEIMEKAFVIILVYSLSFIVVIYWDTTGEVGWIVPLTAVLFACLMWFVLVHYRRRDVISDNEGDVSVEGMAGGVVELANESFNPLSVRSVTERNLSSHDTES